MGPFILLLLALQLCYSSTLSKVLNTPLYAVNSINEKINDYSLHLPAEVSNENDEILDDEDILTDMTDIADDDIPLVQTFEDQTELKFRQPIESVNFDYLRNAVILRFHKNNAKAIMKLDSMENEKKKSLQDNFIRFGKRSYEEYPWTNSVDVGFIDKSNGARVERDRQTARDPRGDNFMRFGRSVDAKNDFMRFGRGTNDFMRFGRSPSTDFMRFGRAAGQDFMRFGRTPSQDFMRFGRRPTQDFMRFGRTPNQDFMRFGRAGKDNFMRFGRSRHENFMRFGRNSNKVPADTNFMRYSRPDNFMRFGRTPAQKFDNFMRFGKSLEKSHDNNASQSLMDKNGLKQAVRLIHDADKNADNENPVDKAMKVLFDQHQQQNSNDKTHSEELNQHNESNDSNDLDLDSDYFLKLTN